MLESRPQGCFSSNYQLFSGKEKVAEFRHGWWREAAELIIGDQLFHIDRKKWGGLFRLLAGDEVVLEARKLNAWKPRMTISLGDDILDLRPQGFSAKTWIVTDKGGQIIGRIGRYSWWSRKSYVDFPDGTPISAQCFMLCVIMFMWNRQMNVGTT